MNRTRFLAVFSGLCLLTAAGLLSAGPLNPPAAPVGSTYKTLAEVEPRIPIPSLPFYITQPGSYYLTGDVSAAGAVSGININASRVTVDLNGFAMVGGPGTQKGIVTVGSPTGITIKNGRIEGFGLRGIEAGNATDSRYEGLTLTGNGFDGLMCGENCIVAGCIARSNGEDGIDTGQNCVVSGCVATGNGSDGFEVEGHSVVSDCVAAQNVGSGIYLYAGARATGCIADRNTANGIVATTTCTVADSTCTSNGFNGTGAGIHVSGADNRIEANTASLNDFGVRVLQAGNLIIRNSTSGNTSASFSIVAGNSMGAILTAATIAASTNPNANYDF